MYIVDKSVYLRVHSGVLTKVMHFPVRFMLVSTIKLGMPFVRLATDDFHGQAKVNHYIQEMYVSCLDLTNRISANRFVPETETK